MLEAKHPRHPKKTNFPENHKIINTSWIRDDGAPVYGAPSNTANEDGTLNNKRKSGNKSMQNHEILSMDKGTDTCKDTNKASKDELNTHKLEPTTNMAIKTIGIARQFNIKKKHKDSRNQNNAMQGMQNTNQQNPVTRDT